MPPPTISLSTFAIRLSSTVSFVDTFEPATIAISGRFGFSSAVSSATSSFISNGPAQATWRETRYAMRARLGAMRRTECIHHIHIAERGHFARQVFLVLFLALVETNVLEQRRLRPARSSTPSSQFFSKRTL